jgi:hypothetical protein
VGMHSCSMTHTCCFLLPLLALLLLLMVSSQLSFSPDTSICNTFKAKR